MITCRVAIKGGMARVMVEGPLLLRLLLGFSLSLSGLRCRGGRTTRTLATILLSAFCGTPLHTTTRLCPPLLLLRPCRGTPLVATLPLLLLCPPAKEGPLNREVIPTLRPALLLLYHK